MSDWHRYFRKPKRSPCCKRLTYCPRHHCGRFGMRPSSKRQPPTAYRIQINFSFPYQFDFPTWRAFIAYLVIPFTTDLDILEFLFLYCVQSYYFSYCLPNVSALFVSNAGTISIARLASSRNANSSWQAYTPTAIAAVTLTRKETVVWGLPGGRHYAGCAKWPMPESVP